MIVDRLDIDVTGAEFARATGWRIEAQGACRGDVCVPLDGDGRTLAAVADRLGMPIVHDDSTGRSVCRMPSRLAIVPDSRSGEKSVCAASWPPRATAGGRSGRAAAISATRLSDGLEMPPELTQLRPHSS